MAKEQRNVFRIEQSFRISAAFNDRTRRLENAVPSRYRRRAFGSVGIGITVEK